MSLVGNAFSVSIIALSCYFSFSSPACWTGICVNSVMNWIRDLTHLKNSHIFPNKRVCVSEITYHSIYFAGLSFTLVCSFIGLSGCTDRLKGRVAFGATV